MNSAIHCILILCVTRVFSVTVTVWPPALQRKATGESCTLRWDVSRNFTTYTIQRLSSGSTTTLGSNANHTFDSSKSVITLLIWNIQTSNAGNYSLSITTGPLTEVNSAAVLFVYATPSTRPILAVGRNPGFEGDTIELNCSVTSNSLPVEFQTKVYYFWYNSYYGGYFRNTSSGPAVLQNGDVLPGFTMKHEGKTVVIASAQSADSSFYCSVKEEGSPLISGLYGPSSLPIYSKPYTYNFSPASRKLNATLYSSVYLYFNCQANPPLTSYTNWNFVNASGSTAEYPVGSNPITSNYVTLSFTLNSVNSYGSYSLTLTNSNGSRTETFQILAPVTGPPDVPSSFNVQYVTHSIVSLQWKCMWFNGAQQTVFVRLMSVTNDEEVETQTVSLAINCYNSAYSTLFQANIQPERNYEASIWSVNTYGSSKVEKLTVRTAKRLIFETSSANISITGTQAAINFSIADSSKSVLWLNITCCVELTTQCSTKSSTIANSDNQIAFDLLPTGTQYVFDFIVYDGDGYTYTYNLAIMKGVRVSRRVDPLECNPNPCGEKKNPTDVAIIVLGVLLGVAVLALIGCLIGFFVWKGRLESTHKQSTTTQPPKPSRTKPNTKEPTEYDNAAEDTYEAIGETDLSNGNAYYTALEENRGRAKVNR